MRKNQQPELPPVPADFLPDGVSLCDPESRGGLAQDTRVFSAAWPQVFIGTDHRGRPAITKTDAARITAYGQRLAAEAEIAAVEKGKTAVEQARVNLAARAKATERAAAERAYAEAEARARHLGTVRDDGRHLGDRSMPPALSQAERLLIDQANQEAIAVAHTGPDTHARRN